MTSQCLESHSEHACLAWGNICHLISIPVQHFPMSTKECRDKGKAAHWLVFLLALGGGCTCVMDLSSTIRTNLSTFLYDLLASIGNGSCVWIPCCFASCFHPRMSKGRLLPLLWLWKDFVNQVSQRTLLDSCSWRKDGFPAWESKGSVEKSCFGRSTQYPSMPAFFSLLLRELKTFVVKSISSLSL